MNLLGNLNCVDVKSKARPEERPKVGNIVCLRILGEWRVDSILSKLDRELRRFLALIVVANALYNDLHSCAHSDPFRALSHIPWVHMEVNNDRHTTL